MQNRYSIEVFAAGTWTDANGVTRTFAINDLHDIARTYNEQNEHTAPVVIGHPVDNTPAQGWTEKLFVKGDRLYATVRDLDPHFTEAVAAGRYRKKSIALYDGGLLRHIGFVAIPAVKGLRDEFSPALFHDDGKSFAEFAAEPTSTNITSTAKPNGADKMDEQQFAELVGKIDSLVNMMNQLLQKIGGAPPAPGAPPAGPTAQMPFGAPQYNEQIAQLNAQLTQAGYQIVPVTNPTNNGIPPNNSEVESLRAQIRESKKTEFAEFLSSKLGTRVPAFMRDTYAGWLLDAHDKDEVARKSGAQFGEANPSNVDRIKTQLGQLPELVQSGEYAEGGTNASGMQANGADKQRELGQRIANANRNRRGEPAK